MFYTILVLLHVIVSFLLVVVILLQSSKGGGLAGSTFGGGPSMSFLGARGTANFLSRATTVLAIIFMLNSLGLSVMLKGIGRPASVTQREMQTGAQNLPRVGEGTDLGASTPGTALPGAEPLGQQQTSPPAQNQPPQGGGK